MDGLERLTIAFATRSVPIGGRAPWERCLGGSESALVFAARALAARGHHVEVFTHCDRPGVVDDVTWRDLGDFDLHARTRTWDVFVSLRFPDLVQRDLRAGLRLLWCQDVLRGGPGAPPLDGWLAWVDRIVFVSAWHRQDAIQWWPSIAPRAEVVRNSYEPDFLPAESPQREQPPLLVHLSRPERGLAPLLAAWPSIHKRFPEATLKVARYRSFHEPAGSQTEAFCLRMDEAVRQAEGADHLGHLAKPALFELLHRATLMVYPADFDETSCINAIEAQACGLPSVAVARGALPETFHPDAAVLVEPGPDLPSRFADRVVELLWDPERRDAMAAAGREHARAYTAAAVAETWEALFLRLFAERSASAGAAIARTLHARGELDALTSGEHPPFRPVAAPGPAIAPFPGLGERLTQTLRRRLGDGDHVLTLTAPPDLSGPPPDAPFDALLDLGHLCCAADRPAFLRWAATCVRPGGRVVHALPHAGQPCLPGQRVQPGYDELLSWFGEDPAIEHDLTLEGEAPWGQPALCRIVSYATRADGSSPAACAPDNPARKLRVTRPVPTVSVCMIVRDAADTIHTALSSVLPIADEYRIVDTGSVDGTLDVIDTFSRRCPVPVHVRRAPWPNDFSVARNWSVEDAEGDWILWIDADEQMVGAERLRRLLQSDHYEAFAIKQHNLIFDRGLSQAEIPFRVYRNHRGYRFYGAVHEHPEVSLNQVIEPWLPAEGVDILDRGYLTEPTRKRKLLARNLALLNLDYQSYPGRRLTDILYLRDCVNLVGFDVLEKQAIRADHRDALLRALDRYEEVCLPERGRYYRLGREYYDRGLALLGLGHELHLAVGGKDPQKVVHRFRKTDDAFWLTADATRRHVERVLLPGRPVS